MQHILRGLLEWEFTLSNLCCRSHPFVHFYHIWKSALLPSQWRNKTFLEIPVILSFSEFIVEKRCTHLTMQMNEQMYMAQIGFFQYAWPFCRGHDFCTFVLMEMIHRVLWSRFTSILYLWRIVWNLYLVRSTSLCHWSVKLSTSSIFRQDVVFETIQYKMCCWHDDFFEIQIAFYIAKKRSCPDECE